MHKNNGATKVFHETAIPKLPKILSKVEIFLKIKLRINEKINLLQILSLPFKTLWTAQNNVSYCLVMFRFQSFSKHNSKHYDVFPILRHLHFSPTTFKKTKKQFHRLLLHIFNMKWIIGFRIVDVIIVISILQMYDTEFDWSFL